MSLPKWFTGMNPVVLGAAALLAAASGGLTTGLVVDGWLTLPGEVALLETRHSSDSLVTQQNRRAVSDLRIVTAELTNGLEELLERVRTIDRRTCITAANNEADRTECANR